MCLSYEDIAHQSCEMVRRWQFLHSFCVLYFQRLLDNLRIRQLADWSTCGLVNSQTEQLMDTDYVDIPNH